MTTTKTTERNINKLDPEVARVLPTFAKKLNQWGWLDLADEISVDAYRGCGMHLLAINPHNGSIHAICYGTNEESPMPIGLAEEGVEVFTTFADRALEKGLVPVWSSFSCWQAGVFELYFDEENYSSYSEWLGRANAR